MAVLLVLTRIVPVADIGDFSLLLGAASISSIMASASLDKAIFSARTDQDVEKLFSLSIVIAFVVGTIIIVAIPISQSLGLPIVNETVAKYSFCFVLYSLLLAANKNLQAMLVYQSQFNLLNKSKLIFTTPAALAQLGVGIVGWGVGGLIYATTAVTAISTFISIKLFRIPWQQIRAEIYFASVKKTFVTNHHFVFFSLPADLVSSFSSQLPIFIIAARFGSISVAMYALVLRVLSIPVGLLGSSVLTVFKDRAGQDYRELGNCKNVYIKTFKNLVLLSCIPFSILHLFGSPIVKFLLGDQWAAAGHYTEILAPMLFVAFISSPLSYVLYFSKRGHITNLCCQIILMTGIGLSFTLSNNISDAIFNYSIFASFYYIFYIFVSYRAALGSHLKKLS